MKKEIDHKVLIKYCFSGCKPGYAIDLEKARGRCNGRDRGVV